MLLPKNQNLKQQLKQKPNAIENDQPKNQHIQKHQKLTQHQPIQQLKLLAQK